MIAVDVRCQTEKSASRMFDLQSMADRSPCLCIYHYHCTSQRHNVFANSSTGLFTVPSQQEHDGVVDEKQTDNGLTEDLLIQCQPLITFTFVLFVLFLFFQDTI